VNHLLRMRGAAFGYGGRTVLAGVDLDVLPGELWFLIGPNGEGKTTLLRGILGEVPPREGTLELAPAVASRQALGFVPQRLELRPTLPATVREFVTLGLVGIRLSRAGRRERLRRALERVGLPAMEERDYWALSGGQRQRALVARALVRDPDFLIADEPTAGLDLPGTETLLGSIRDLNRSEGLTVIIASHDLAAAARHATHAALCSGGRLIAGPAADVLTPENLRRVFRVPVRVAKDEAGASTFTVESTRSGP